MDAHICRKCQTLGNAAFRDHLECIRKLIADGADPNATDVAGMTPLHWAASMGHDACTRELIAAGTNPNAEDNTKQTPLHLTILGNYDAYSAVITTGEMEAYRGQHASLDILIGAGGNPNVADICGTTPLHLAAKCHSVFVQKLIDAGANPNVDDNRGTTPLHLAAFHGRVTVVKTLITAGAKPDVVDNDGYTPLRLAVERECVKVMIECILTKRVLKDDEWGLVPLGSDIGHLLPVVMIRDGHDAAAKLVSRLPEEKRKVLETTAMCLSRLVPRDLTEQILVRCV